MLRVAVLVALATACLAFRPELDAEWNQYKKTHRKFYDAASDNYRRAIWEDNVDFIQSHNLEADRGLHTFWVGMNEYGDLALEEFTALMNGYVMPNVTETNPRFVYVASPFPGDVPAEVDWRQKGYVTKVKNQGHCGSCWAFSTTGSLEGQHFKKSGTLVSLSEQNLVDCSKREGNKGCKGGLMDLGFTYIKKNGGIDTEESYPYRGVDGLCKFKERDVGATDTGFVDVQRGSEDALQQAVASVGPIAVAMDAGHRSFQLYRTGIYSEPACSSTKLDHGVLAVGYGSESSQDYWLVKNSWGTTWGMEGYFRLARNHRNMCGLATQASYPKV